MLWKRQYYVRERRRRALRGLTSGTPELLRLEGMTLLAETCYGHDGWPFPFLFPVILLTVLLVTRPWRRRRCAGADGLSVLAERYARGEIDADEYRSRLEVLRRR